MGEKNNPVEVTHKDFDYSKIPLPIRAPLERLAVEIHGIAARGIFGIGKRLHRARDYFGSGTPEGRSGLSGDATWDAWCLREAGISRKTANDYIKIYEMIDRRGGDGRHLMGVKALRYLTGASVPDDAIEAALNEAKATKVTGRRAKEIIREHLPTPTEASRKAKETGITQPASDGRIYTGATKEEVDAADDRNTLIYGIRDAIDLIADVGMSPSDWLDRTNEYPELLQGFQRDKVSEAQGWLSALYVQLRIRKKDKRRPAAKLEVVE